MNDVQNSVSYKEIIDIARFNRPEVAINLISGIEETDFNSLAVEKYCITTVDLINSFLRKKQDIKETLNIDWEEVNYSLISHGRIRILKINHFGDAQDVNMNNLLQWLYFRMGLSLQILDKTVEHLRNRYVGKQEQIKLQLIKADIAQFLTEYISVVLDVDNYDLLPYQLSNLHKRITFSNEYLVKLCGAHGYLMGDTIDLYYISRIIEAIYSLRGEQ